MKRWLLALVVPLAVPLPTSATVLGGDAAACTGGPGPGILVDVVGLKDRAGELTLELYPPDAADFLKDDRDLLAAGRLFRRVRAPTPPAGEVRMCMRVPRPGRYALLFTHNRDGRNKFSIWEDGAGFVSNRKLGRSRPKVEEAIVEVPAGGVTVTIRAQYLRGLGGFGPVD